MRQTSRALVRLAVVPLLAGCTARTPQVDTAARGDALVEVYSDCDPIAPTTCGLPFPSTFYMREDTTTPTGWRITLGPTTLPINANDYQPVPDFWNERDGWSINTPAIAHLPDASVENLPGLDDLAASLDPEANSILIDADTGERIPHFVERDVSIVDGPDSVLLLHPVKPLMHGHRHVVGFRNIVDGSGAAIPPSDAFKALRDGAGTDTWDVEGRRPVYDDLIFPTLEAAGWSRPEVTIAWDFVTQSQEGATGRAAFMRDDALARIPDGGPGYTIDEIVDSPNEDTAFRLKGHMTVPLYTTEDKAGTFLTRDGDGMPYANGETRVPFTVIVPNSLVNEARPGAVVQYGHGLLGGQGEVHTSYLAEMANRYGWIVFAVDWTGMKDDDVSAITLMLVNNLDQFAMIPERSHQGFVEFLYAMELVTGPLARDPALMVEDPADGSMISLVDPDQRHYYGNSQGAIMGGAYAAIAPYFDTAVLGVGGGPYHMLLTRSRDFDPFFMIFKTMYPDPKQIALWLGLMQTLWDSAEGSGYANVITDGLIPDSTPTRVLQQVAIGDAQVTTYGAHILARGQDARLIGTPVRPVWGLETASGPHAGSALVEWDYGITVPSTNTPPQGDDPHEAPRRARAGQDQIDHFFRTGEVIDFCGGPCQDLEAFSR